MIGFFMSNERSASSMRIVRMPLSSTRGNRASLEMVDADNGWRARWARCSRHVVLPDPGITESIWRRGDV